MYRDQYRWGYREPDPPVVMIKDDKLGKERFQKLEEQIKQVTLSKELTRQYEKTMMVFYHRLQIAEQAEFPRTYPEAHERLEKFRSVKFFLDAMTGILEAAQKEIADNLKKPAVKKKAQEEVRKQRANDRYRYRWE